MKKDQRQYPRFKVTFPLEIVTTNGDVFGATVINLSRSGMELACDRKTTHHITPQSHRMTPDQNIQVHLRFNLPASKLPPAAVDVHCRVIACRRYAEDEYRIGVQHSSFEGDSLTNLENYILERMRVAQGAESER